MVVIKGDCMKGNVYKKGIFIIVLLLLMFSAISCINAAQNTSDTANAEMLSLSKGGVVINYPSNWGYSESTSQYSILAISKLDSIDSAGFGQVNINIEKKPIEGEFYTFVNDTSEKITRSSWTLMDFLLPNFKIITGNLRKPYIFNPLPALLNITVRCKIMI